MKSHKHQRSARLVKSRPIVESEDDEDLVIQPLLHGVLEVVVPWLSTIVVIAGSHPAVIEPSQPTPTPLVQVPPVMPVVDILIPGPNNPCYACHKQSWPCATWSDKRTGAPCMSCIYCTTKKIKCTPTNMGSPPPRLPPKLPPRRPPHPKPPAPPQLPLPPNPRPELTTQTCGRSKTITAIKPLAPAPAPAPLLSSRSAVPAAALARIALLKACVAEQDGKIDTLQCLHEGLRHKIIDWHPSFPLPDTPANATSLLLDQSSPRTMSPPGSALPPLIDLSMETLAPTTVTLTFPDASAIEGLLFNYDQVVHPED
ncbi:hypothetical protein BDR03DRAFT_1019322 [Suillus americanus]|nr:hypothetical protein BDR03DRAFT_1019322 [Suillus americanus]